MSGDVIKPNTNVFIGDDISELTPDYSKKE
jgi:hypothetical protein